MCETQASRRPLHRAVPILLALLLLVLAAALPAAAHEPPFSVEPGRERCTFVTSGSNTYHPLWPGYSLLLEGEEEDDEEELVEISVEVEVLTDTEMVDGVRTRVLEERESEDGELVEVSRNFVAICRETGDLWYFGEDVDDYEDGEIVGHEGAWRAGVNGAMPGILMPGNPINGARYHQELAPGVAEDRGEIVGIEDSFEVPAGTFEDVLHVVDTDPLDEESEGDSKRYAPGVGLIQDEVLELVEIVPPPCLPDATTLCLQDGRFRVRAEWVDHQLDEGPAMANPISDDSGEFWFFNASNVELLVKVLDACALPDFQTYWVFAAGLTNVEVTLTVTDTLADQTREYENPLGNPYDPVLDTSAFQTCP